VLKYELEVLGPSPEGAAGVFLHRRLARPNGGVAYNLAGPGTARTRGHIRLLEGEAADLMGGRCYISVISKTNLRQSARGDIVWN
jgi:hypothetical protein